MIVATTTDAPLTLEATLYRDMFNFQPNTYDPGAFTVTGSTIYALKSPDHSNFKPLTIEALTQQQSWPPTTVTIYHVNEEVFYKDNTSSIVYFLFDPDTGLPVIISSAKENAIPYHRGHAGLVFTGYSNPQNP